MTDAPVLDWSFELPAAGDGATGLQDYVVELEGGDHLGKVATVLRREGEIYVVVEHGMPPIKNELVVVPWNDVREVDHDALTVVLALDRAAADRAPRLDRGRKVEQGDAEATRVTEIPTSPVSATAPAASPPAASRATDRPAWTIPLAAGLLGVFSALVVAIFASSRDFGGWHFASIAVPVALLGFAGYWGYRVFRDPYERS